MLPEPNLRSPSVDAIETTEAQTGTISPVSSADAAPKQRMDVSDENRLVPIRLSAQAFAPYGKVIRRGQPVRVNDGFAVRRDALTDLPCSDRSARLCLSVFDVDVRPAPTIVSEVERHPHSAQLFLPISPCWALVVVAGRTADGAMDCDSLAAFVVAPDEGILYAPGVWHLGLTSLDRPGRFQMAMWCGDLPDTEVRRLPRAFSVETSGLTLDSLRPANGSLY